MCAKKQKQFSYAKAMDELQQIVDALQQEEVAIDELSEKARSASQLIRQCRQKLRDTEAELDSLLGEE